MRTGLMRHRIRIDQRANNTLDAFGGRTGTWTEFLTTWAQYEPQSGREFIANGAQASMTMVRFVCRWYPGVTPKMRVVFNGAVYNITAVLDDRGRQRQMTLVCDTGADNGD